MEAILKMTSLNPFSCQKDMNHQKQRVTKKKKKIVSLENLRTNYYNLVSVFNFVCFLVEDIDLLVKSGGTS